MTVRGSGVRRSSNKRIAATVVVRGYLVKNTGNAPYIHIPQSSSKGPLTLKSMPPTNDKHAKLKASAPTAKPETKTPHDYVHLSAGWPSLHTSRSIRARFAQSCGRMSRMAVSILSCWPGRRWHAAQLWSLACGGAPTSASGRQGGTPPAVPP